MKDLLAWLKVVVEIALIVLAVFCVIWLLRDVGLAEEANGQAWVICHPDSYVCLRSGAGKKKAEIGGFDCGAHLYTDSVEKNGFLHVVDLSAEDEQGWISLNYVVFNEPHEVNEERMIKSEGRVACRKCIDGKITGWAKNKDKVFVFWMSDSWAVTNKGYIQSRFIK